MTACWFDRGGKTLGPGDAPPDYTIRDLPEILDILREEDIL